MDHPKKNRTIITTGIFTILAGSAVILGWILNAPVLQSIVPGFTGMRFNAGLCFVLFGAALLLTQYNTGRYNALLYLITVLSGTLIGLATLSQDIFHFDYGIDQIFVFDKTLRSYSFPFPGRMAFNASINFTLLGLGFLGLTLKKPLFTILSQCLFHIVAILSAIALIGYLYGISFFRVFLYETSMATHTAILFFILSLAASLLNPSIGLTRLFTGKRIGNQMAKRLFILMFLMVALFVAWSIPGRRFGLFSSPDLGISIFAVCFLLASLLIIWNAAEWLNKIDIQRSVAETKVKLMNTELEKRVEERSAEFRKSEARYRSLIEQASDAIYVLDFAGNFTDVNASMCKMIGYTRDELLQMNVEQIIDPNELITDPLPKTLNNQGEAEVRERTFLRKGRSMFNVEINVKKFSDDRIMVIARDITGRKKMEAELREAELKFRTIAEKSMVGVYIVQNNRFVYVNPRFAAVFGYEPGELVNMQSIETIIHENYRAITTENVRRRISGEVESIHYETMGKKKDGSSNWVEFYGSRAIIGDEPTIIGSMIDITKRKQAEEELRSSEQKYKLLFDSNPMPMWMITKDDQIIVAVNDAAAHHYGYTKDELLYHDVKFLRLKEDSESQMAGYKKKMDYLTDRGIVRHLKKDGTIMFVQLISHDIIFEGRPVRLSLTNDITEKLRAEESLKKSEANLQTILNTTDTAYVLFDMELRALAFNPKAAEFVKARNNHEPEKGDNLANYFPPERFPEFAGLAGDVLNGRNINYELNYPQADGTLLWYYVRLFPITNNKEILGMMMALDDITERKNAEHDLKNAYVRIQSHIDSIKDMAWKQSHLIRSPLANLKGLVDLLREDPSEPTIFTHIHDELNRMDNIIIQMAKDASDHDTNDQR